MRAHKNSDNRSISIGSANVIRELKLFKDNLISQDSLSEVFGKKIDILCGLFDNLQNDPEYYYPIYFEHQELRERDQSYSIADQFMNRFVDAARRVFYTFAENEYDIPTQFIALRRADALNNSSSLVKKSDKALQEILKKSVYDTFCVKIANLKQASRSDDAGMLGALNRFWSVQKDRVNLETYYSAPIASVAYSFSSIIRHLNKETSGYIRNQIPSDKQVEASVACYIAPLFECAENSCSRINNGILIKSEAIEDVINQAALKKPIVQIAGTLDKHNQATLIATVETTLKKDGIVALLLRIMVPNEIAQLDEAIKHGVPVGRIFKSLDELIKTYGLQHALDGVTNYIKTHEATVDRVVADFTLTLINTMRTKLHRFMDASQSYLDLGAQITRQAVDTTMSYKQKAVDSITWVQQGIAAIANMADQMAGGYIIQSLPLNQRIHMHTLVSATNIWHEICTKVDNKEQAHVDKEQSRIVSEIRTKREEEEGKAYLNDVQKLFHENGLSTVRLSLLGTNKDTAANVARSEISQKQKQLSEREAWLKKALANGLQQVKKVATMQKVCQQELDAMKNAFFIKKIAVWFMSILGFDTRKRLEREREQLELNGETLVKQQNGRINKLGQIQYELKKLGGLEKSIDERNKISEPIFSTESSLERQLAIAQRMLQQAV